MAYEWFKVLHLLGVVMLVGNVTATSIWKVFADRSREPRIIAHAQYLVTVTDWLLTMGGILLLVIGGFGAAYVAGMDPFGDAWIVRSELLFVLSGAIWVFILIPTQIRQARQVRTFRDGGPIPEAYWRESRRWLVWGVVATLPLLAAIYTMVHKF